MKRFALIIAVIAVVAHALLGAEKLEVNAKTFRSDDRTNLIELNSDVFVKKANDKLWADKVVIKTDKKRTNTKSNPHSRPDWINITPSMPFYAQKRQILAIWKKLGYSMSSLDTRVQREFNCYSFVWLRDEKSIIALLTDLQKREAAFEKKNGRTRITSKNY